VAEGLAGAGYFFLSGFRDELTRFKLVFLESSFEPLLAEELSFDEESLLELSLDEASDLDFSDFSSFFESELPPSDAGA
jgi:hypothetical protein